MAPFHYDSIPTVTVGLEKECECCRSVTYQPITFILMCVSSFFLFLAGQMFLMDRFFDGTFLTFGIEVISFAERDQEDRIDPMVYIFPRMTKCTFHKFGTSGEIEKHDAMCILPLNIVISHIILF